MNIIKATTYSNTDRGGDDHGTLGDRWNDAQEVQKCYDEEERRGRSVRFCGRWE